MDENWNITGTTGNKPVTFIRQNINHKLTEIMIKTNLKGDNKMKKIFKGLSIGLLLGFIAAVVLSLSGCAGKSASLTSNEDAGAKIDTTGYAAYEGKYELAPKFIMTVTKEGNNLYTQATGQPKFEIFPESEDKFFVKVFVAKIKFNRNAEGDVESLTLFQNGQKVPAKKLNI